MDAIDMLKHDHRMVEQLFRDYQAAASPDQRRGVVDIMIRELSKHAAVEEEMFYPLASRVLPDGESRVRRHLDQHKHLKRDLAALDGLHVQAADGTATDEALQRLQHDIARHVEQDERDLMPKVRAAVDEQALTELGSALDQAKHVAPTRPHPDAPDEPPALTLAAPIAAIYDRLRDRIAHRPRT